MRLLVLSRPLELFLAPILTNLLLLLLLIFATGRAGTQFLRGWTPIRLIDDRGVLQMLLRLLLLLRGLL